MTTTFRCIIFAAVSSVPQANDDKASIPSQIENARTLLRRRNWEEVFDPLVVPGQSRHIDFLHEALEEIPALSTLLNLAQKKAIDLVIVRDYDRLARTRSLLTQISAYLNRSEVQIYALDKPVEPVHPGDLHQHSDRLMAGAMVEAFAGIEAEREINRLRNRRRFGMNASAKRGLFKTSTPPYGYTRKDDSGILVIVPEEAAIIKRIEHLYLNEGMSWTAIARHLNLDGTPAPRTTWHPQKIGNIIHSPFYCGYIVYGLRRRKKVFSPTTGKFILRNERVPSYQALCNTLKHRPSLEEILFHQSELEADDVVIAAGLHEPLRTREQHAELERESTKRKNAGGRAASLDARYPRLFSGLIRCSECGATMTPIQSPTKQNNERTYYFCVNARLGLCSSKKWIRESNLYTDVVAVIDKITSEPHYLDTYLKENHHRTEEILETELASTTKALNSCALSRKRWDDAYEGMVIDLSTYQQKLTEIETKRKKLTTRLANLERRVTATRNQERARQRILDNKGKLPTVTTENRGEVKLLLRSLINRIIVKNGKLVKLVIDD